MLLSVIVLFFLHFIADFILQSREMGKNKSSHFPTLVKHCFIQLAVFLIGGAAWLSYLNPGAPFYIILIVAGKFALVNAIIHGVIDWNIWKGYKYFATKRAAKLAVPESYAYWEDHWFYTTIGLDQFLHAATILGLLMVL